MHCTDHVWNKLMLSQMLTIKFSDRPSNNSEVRHKLKERQLIVSAFTHGVFMNFVSDGTWMVPQPYSRNVPCPGYLSQQHGVFYRL